MTTGPPPISPHPDRRTPVVSFLGADEAAVGDMMDGNEFLCGVCNGDGAVFGVEDDVDKELKASDEGEQAVSTCLCLPRSNLRSVSLWTTV